jgi:hypothetical protein
MRDTMTAVRDPQTWTDAAREYGQALVAGTSGPGGKMTSRAMSARIGKYAEGMGYNVTPEGSNLSSSQYLTLTHDALPDSLKIRMSDHELPPSYGSPGNYDIRPSDGSFWAEVVKSLADKVGADVPAPVRSILTKAEAQKAADAALQRQSPAYQEAMLAKDYPDEWAADMGMDSMGRSAGRRDLAAKYEADNPNDPIKWAPYLKPRVAGLAGGGAAAMAQPAQSDGWEPVSQEPQAQGMQ